MRLRWRDALRLVFAHYVAAVFAGGVFAVVRGLVALSAAPDFSAWMLLWYLAAIQTAIVGGAAAAIGVMIAAAVSSARRYALAASGAVWALVLSLLIDQFNLTFVAPAVLAGAAYGEALNRLVWRRQAAAP